MDNLDAELMLALQRGIPLVTRPFRELGRTLGLGEQAVLTRLARFEAEGIVRRFGAVFDSRQLGYGSTLCAVDVTAPQLDGVAAKLVPHPGITHCYEREGHPNLWFTVTAPAEQLADTVRELTRTLEPHSLLDMPARRRFKVQVVLDPRRAGPAPDEEAAAHVATGPAPKSPADIQPPTPRERAVVRRLQGSIPIGPNLFAILAAELQYDDETFLDLLRAWQEAGTLRRIGLILRHRQAGFTVNGMCVWHVESSDIARAGHSLAACAQVTHCYERVPVPEFPFNLFAMIHAGTRDAARSILRELERKAGVCGGRMLVSLREFKKSSPRFFCEEQ